MQAILLVAAVALPAAVVEGGFAWGAAGALLATLASAGVQLWRGRSQSKVETATAEKLKQEAGQFIDERWERLSRQLASRVDEVEAENAELRKDNRDLHAQVEACHTEIAELRVQLESR